MNIPVEKIKAPQVSQWTKAEVLEKAKDIQEGDIEIKDQAKDPKMAEEIDKKVKGGEEMVRVPDSHETWHFQLPSKPQLSELWQPTLDAIGIGVEAEKGFQNQITDLIETTVDLLGDENPKKLFKYLSERLGEFNHLMTNEKKLFSLLRILKFELEEKNERRRINESTKN